jgi:predicted ester cyclase
MKIHSLVASLSFLLASLVLLLSPGCDAQTPGKLPNHTAHKYTAYEQLILKNVSQFHKNFDNRAWDKNGELVADDVHVNSNGTELHGRDAFVQRIKRFVGPFPDVKITDLGIVVDGDVAVTRFIVTGTQKGDFQTPEGLVHASNRPIKVDGIEYFTFDKEGKLIDLVTVENLAQLFDQVEGKN